ncbi:MAG: NADH-quinone oxidoreductase subunit J family protein [Fervidicoccaceae archaeon]
MSLLGNVLAWSILFGTIAGSFLATVLALLMIRERSLVYNAFMLAGIGISVAGLISFLGYQVIGAAQLIVYVGASVMFFIISLSMMGDLRVKIQSSYVPLLVGLLASALFYYLITVVIREIGYEVGPTTITTRTFSAFLTSDFFFSIFIIMVTLVFVSIIAIYLAKRKGGEQ